MTQLPYFILLGLSHSIYYCEIANYNNELCTPDKVKAKQLLLNECLDRKEGAYAFSQTLMRPSGSIAEFLKKRCAMKPHLDDCLDLWLDLIKECVNADDLRGLEVWKKIDTEIINYVCAHDAEAMTSLLKNRYHSCRQGLSRILADCSRSLGITAPFYEVDKVRQKCNKIGTMESCVTSKLERNCMRNATELAKPLFHIVKTNLCSNAQ
ncbi:27 kDa hemolymph glycoprotein-like isoform X1 [Diabrotica undecimpunctata]|uniref:27 kDa hemolymph glycoprotein-like isoform X1 n=1 Tax=Diabrotica undecimpunctata TaxID=50387 RepID=UPI003B63261A